MARHRDRKKRWLWLLPALLVLVVAAIFWTDHVASEGDIVASNVRFAGIDISGETPREVAKQVSNRETELLRRPVVVNLGEGRVSMTADEIGYDYLYDETVSRVVSARHSSTPWNEFVAWASTPFSTVRIKDHYVLDEERARARLSLGDFVIEQPVEPSIAIDSSGDLQADPGETGVGVDIDRLIDDLESADIAGGTVDLEAVHVPIEPTVSLESAETFAREMNRLTRRGFLAVAGSQSNQLTPDAVRRHLSTTVEDGEMTMNLDVVGLEDEVEAGFAGPVSSLVPPDIEVVDGEVTVVSEGQPPLVCCSRDSVRSAFEDYLSGGPAWSVLDPRPSDDVTLRAWADGTLITEPVAEFTTSHRCCENRVVNIHTIADALTGKYLVPGETFSLNELVGPRTREKGYLPAGAIRGGHMTDEVGGGVSQFVTTLFNAAFFAGLDLDEYQSHTVYFSRYPFGREATLSMPAPDLVMTNDTDHPVLIWPTYTDTSITVTIYSTANVDVEELDQRVSYRNRCRHSEIDRQRTFSDGRVEIDTIVANYRPADGIDCNGNSIPRR